jgi:hypothetical protein
VKRLASTYDCLVQSSNHYSDWTLLYLLKGTVVLAPSTYVYWQALLGQATQVRARVASLAAPVRHASQIHFPAVGFFHSRHNTCMFEEDPKTHFSQIRLEVNDPRYVYHDIYARNFHLTYDQYMRQAKALPCVSIVAQHVCEGAPRKNRYCYIQAVPTTIQQASASRDQAQHAARAA